MWPRSLPQGRPTPTRTTTYPSPCWLRSIPPAPAPSVTGLERFGFHHQPTALVLTFDRPLDPARAELTSNYRLVALFHGGRLRVPVAIASAVYDPTQNTVTLTPKPHGRPFLPLHREYELTVVGTGGSGITAADGTPLAGRGGVPGTDAVRRFRFEILAGSNRPGALTSRSSVRIGTLIRMGRLASSRAVPPRQPGGPRAVSTQLLELREQRILLANSR